MLGPLEVRGPEGPVSIRGRHHPKILALLLDAANQTVPVDKLVEALWEGDPPVTGTRQAQNIAAGLRRQLGPAGARLERVGLGYRLAVRAEELDLLRCKRLEALARDHLAAGRLEPASQALTEALREWRGPSLAGMSGRRLDTVGHRLDEYRLRLLEARIDVDLRLGRRDMLVAELRRLVADHPRHERFTAQLMVVLYRCGRTPEALRAFAELGERLAEELGVEPGAEVRDLHTAILRGELRPGPAPAPAAPETRPVVPVMLPPDNPVFSGRLAPLQALHALLGEPAPGLATVTGTGGVGKTTLAVRWALEVAERFPDGQLYLNLRGFDPHSEPMAPAEGLRLLLAALGVPPQRTHTDPGTLLSLYRSLIADRAVLVVLDNARDAEQVRPLLPGGPRTFTVVTSRNRLSGLVAAQGARPVPLDLLTPGEATGLLEARLGKQRIADEPEAVDRIVESSGGLPLALAVVAARAATRADFSLAAVAAQLDGGLDGFEGEEPATDVRSVLSWSYRALSPAAARMFRLLGLHPGADFSAPAAAGLAAVSHREARRLLRELAAAHLLAEGAPGRFTFHDLLRDYAGELAAEHEDDAARREAVRRLLDHYLCTFNLAADLASPSRDPLPMPPEHPDAVPERFDDHVEGVRWVKAELSNLLAAANLAARTGFDAHVWPLVWPTTYFSPRVGGRPGGVETLELALAVATRNGDTTGRVQVHRLLHWHFLYIGRLGEADRHLARALDLCDETGVRALRPRIHRSFGILRGRQGRFADALDHSRRGLRIFREIGHPNGEAAMLNAIGWYQLQLGRTDEAFEHCRRSLERCEALDDWSGQGIALDSLASVQHVRGRHGEAVAMFHRAIDRFERAYDHPNQADSLERLTEVHRSTGDLSAARDVWLRRIGVLEYFDPHGAAEARGRLREFA
ncbi:BTAD domain-containing putative transcriptional regulator [Glycomyces sp. NPDC047010]|uniref:AfsR/SARP family transcriptional regulator n=1 Tax=Glycomyces sp. NPDC047010 TaxID=3155023 RepID=UPI00340C5358